MVITQTCTGDDFNKAMEAQKTRIVYGWVCPKCGRGNSPCATVCPCGPDVEIATGNSGYVKLVKTRWGGYFTTADGE